MTTLHKIFGILFLFSLILSGCNRDLSTEELFAKAEEKNQKWRYIPISGMVCRDGSGTGIGVRLNSDSDNLLIYMEGGGACFNTVTCLPNPASWGKVQFEGWKNTALQLGIFDKRNDDNPFKDWNLIYIPYCTGDVHSGTTSKGNGGPGFKDLKMKGFDNMTLALVEISKHFESKPLAEVFLTGTSAGGFGVLTNANQVAETFSDAKVTVMDDSGPILLTQEAEPDCLDNHWEEVFKWHIPADFATYTSGSYGSNIKSIYEYLGNKHPEVEFGLVSATKDLVIRGFYGYGHNDCEPLLDVAVVVPAEDYKNGLLHLRDSVLAGFDNWHTYYVDNVSHTFNPLPSSFNSLEIEGTRFNAWIDQLRNREAENVGVE